MHEKTCLVTGATQGVGKETALQLARKGAQVVIVGRSKTRTAATVEWIKKETGNDHVEFLVADLSSQQEVRALAGEFMQTHNRLDILINNAGGIFSARQHTVDGFELTWALNHLAYFTLTLELLELLKDSSPSRIINVSSGLHAKGEIDFDDLQFENGYKAMTAYRRSKLANILFTYTLARRLAGTGVTANCLTPGVTATGFGHNNKGLFKIAMTMARPFMKSASKGAETSVYLATSQALNNVSGKYFEDCRPAASSDLSHDTQLQDRLWNVSLEAVSRFSEPSQETSAADGL